jgi:nucleotide sugar dehydrogenase
MRAIPKIISALTPESLDVIAKLYGPAFDNLVRVSSPEVAEMTKLYENCQRMVCFAYANEMADACGRVGIDPYEVARAAGTKPFGFAPYAPGLGVGGHCIPINPFYLLSNCEFPLLEKATAMMWERPRRIAERALARLAARRALSDGGVTLCDGADLAPLESGNGKPRVLVVGLGFKRGQSNLSNSPGVELVKALSVSRQVEIAWADALVPQEAFSQVARLPDSQWTVEHVSTFDLVVVSFRQVDMDMSVLEEADTEVEMWCP